MTTATTFEVTVTPDRKWSAKIHGYTIHFSKQKVSPRKWGWSAFVFTTIDHSITAPRMLLNSGESLEDCLWKTLNLSVAYLRSVPTAEGES